MDGDEYNGRDSGGPAEGGKPRQGIPWQETVIQNNVRLKLTDTAVITGDYIQASQEGEH